ncbi:hypothetical protein HDE76_000526 [Rhodanobacter sp. ANJX3]|uniref:abortive infection system antitoxin AbiGi family protein n=1 Tax=Rhodanobacter sp. ANJX3 TaxID=2723083 RepID=UPI001622F052|nr:abortive infection system antitoxin AbiGi family protein [Rhodanobacter sp. ANJX3]MBB5357344.1 hypothetical protein [Rhodanobacter sp. ANJX3]
MFTDHEVNFSVTEDKDQLWKIIQEILPILHYKLATLGLKLESLPEDRKQTIFAGLGRVKSKIPMVCLTEIPPGKILSNHRMQFGSYALVLKPSWVSSNEADRVIYIGQNSPTSRAIFRCLATMNILGLNIDKNGLLLFDMRTNKEVFSLISYYETRENVTEAEWRVCGETGYFGGTRSTGTTVPLGLDDIDHIFVPACDIEQTKKLVENLANAQSVSVSPSVGEFPQALEGLT